MNHEKVEKELLNAAQILSNDRFAIRDYFASLGTTKLGFSREEIYWVALGLIRRDPPLVTSEIAGDVMEFMDSLIGHCSQSSIVRFETDPSELDHDAFVKYVRDKRWTNNPDVNHFWPTNN